MPKEYECVNIQGTKNLLEIWEDSKEVQAFIYISSSTPAKGLEHIDLDENCILVNEDPNNSAYAKSKALAEIMVLRANDPFLSKGNAVKEKSWK
jgi:sterol-4alpha-carboxylate 3-dehydrogenase (decarboxylating)